MASGSTASGSTAAPGSTLAPPPRAANLLAWLRLLGPGAIVASLTIGTGELIFSARAGALFGYGVLWVFLLTLVLKWALVLAPARHLVLSGAHPFERWMELPGPRGWFPLLFLVLAAACFPIWVGFHASVIGTVGTWLEGSDHHLWGAGVLTLAFLLALLGGYATLERLQIGIVAAMLVCAGISICFLGPDWLGLLQGLVPRPLRYPEWLGEAQPGRVWPPVWVETAIYVGVVGGASYDYLAYLTYAREKAWGFAGGGAAPPAEIAAAAADPSHPLRQWTRAPAVDLAASFAAVAIFSALFLAGGVLILAPSHQVPSGTDLVRLQESFVTSLGAGLRPLYVAGVLLTLGGTLYGTLEVAPAILTEVVRAFSPALAQRRRLQLRRLALLWCGAGGYGVLAWSYFRHGTAAAAEPPDLVAILSPAALFTSVFACGLVALLNPWMDRRFLPRSLRMGRSLLMLNCAAAALFIALGIKSYWDRRSPVPVAVAGGAVLLSAAAAAFLGRKRDH